MSLLRIGLRRGPGALTAAFALAALLASGAVAPAEARDGEGRHSPRGGPAAMFERADLDGDGRITRAEMGSMRDERFRRIDADGDGLLTVAELTAKGHEKAGRRAERMLERADENGDGAISSAEFAALADRRAAHMFERVDANGDGALDRAEVEAMKGKGRRHGPRGGDAAQ